MENQLKELNALLSKKVSQNEYFEVGFELNECSEQAAPNIKNDPLMGKMVFRLIKGHGIVKDTETYGEMVSFIEKDFNPKKYK
jgi:phage terminase large subunit-like protein